MSDLVRGDQPRDLRIKRDAVVVSARPLSRTEQTARMKVAVEILTGDHRWPLLEQANRMAARGTIRKLQRDPLYNWQTGLYELRVVRLKPEPPAWRRPLLVTLAIVGPIATFVALAWWALASLAVFPFATLLLLLGGGVLGAALVSRHKQSISINQNVTIKR
jgi:hypothetical protein